MVDHDRLTKELFTTFFDEGLEFAAPSLALHLVRGSAVFLDKQVFTDVTEGRKYEADIVAKVRLAEEDACILIHIESQSSARKEFPLRMFRYFARLHETHGLPVYPIAFFTYRRPAAEAPNGYQVRIRDRTVLDFRFDAVQLNRLDWWRYVNSDNPVATALMSQMNVAEADRPRVKLECLRAFVKQGWDPARLRLLIGYVDSYLPLEGRQQETFEVGLEESGLARKEEVMEIVTSWEREGLRKGLLQGRREGQQDGAAQLVLRQLRRRLGILSEERETMVRGLPIERLDLLGEALLDFSAPEDLDAWLKP